MKTAKNVARILRRRTGRKVRIYVEKIGLDSEEKRKQRVITHEFWAQMRHFVFVS
jgi:methylmalonyl-CoA mutase cobalamin-binding subunit